MKALAKTISSLFVNVKSSIKHSKANLLRFFAAIIIFGVIFLNSGYTYTYLIEDTFSQTMVLVISFLIVGLIYVLTKDFTRDGLMAKSKKPSWVFIVFCSFAISAFFTIFITKETSSLMMYMSFGIRIFAALLIADLLSFDRFIKYYQIGIFVLTLFAIFVFSFTLASGTNFALLPTFQSGKGTVFYNYFFLTFQYGSENRMQGIFWEPGMLASFLLLALSFEIIFRKKIRPVFFIVYLVGLILTFSTFGYLCLLLVLIIFINKKVDNWIIATILYVGIFGGIFVFVVFYKDIVPVLAKWLPNVFGKLEKNGVISFLFDDRPKSLVFDWECWLKKPIFGNGMFQMTKYYEEEAVAQNIHAQTSTLTYFCAEFGILGLLFPVFFIIGLLKIKKIEIENRLCLLILYLLILFKEPHQGIMFDYVFLFLVVKEGIDKNYKAVAFDDISEHSIIRSLAKKDNDSIMKRNILFSFAIKGLALILGFFSYPLYMRYFDSESVLGVWLTILSIMSMIITFDLGFGNGLRNKLVKPLLENDTKKQNELITSTYISTTLLSLIIFAILATLIYTIDINSLMGISSEIVSPAILRVSMLIVTASICIEFTLKNISVILQSLQKQAFANMFALISTICLMLFASIVKIEANETKLLGISIFYAIIINLPLIIGTIIVLRKYFPNYSLKRKDFSKTAVKEVTTLAIGFFIIQMMLLVINSTNELLISNFYGSETTVVYADYNKLIQIIISLFATITLPYWSMVAKMKEQGDVQGIFKLIKKLLIFVGVFSLLLALTAVFFQPLLDIWLAEKSITVDTKTLIFFVLYAFLWILAVSFSAIANGLSIIKKQIYLYVTAAIVKIVGSVLFGIVFKASFGWEYIVLTNAVACGILAIGLPLISFLQLRKIKEVKSC